MVVEGACHLVVLTGRLVRLGMGLVWCWASIPAVAELEFGPSRAQRESQAHPGQLGENGLACPVVGVVELDLHIGGLRGDRAGGAVECAGQLFLRAGDETHVLP